MGAELLPLASDLGAARSQMAFTLGFHIILASLGVAFPAIILIANYRGLRKNDADALLYGRRTWRVMADAWPGRAGDPFADRMNELPKYVASRTLGEGDMEWNSQLLPADDALGAVRRLRAQGSGDMQVMGSANLARQLVENDLVDELRLMIEPVILGGGKRIFPDDGTMRPLELVSSSTSGTGVQIAVYRPAA